MRKVTFSTIYIFLLITGLAWGADLTFDATVNNNWSEAGNWAPNHNATPGTSDNVIIAANCTVDTAGSCANFTLNTGVTISGSANISAYGNFVTESGSTWSMAGIVGLKGTSKTITTNSVVIGTVTAFWVQTGGTYTLNDNLNLGSASFGVLTNSSSFSLGGNTLTCGKFGDGSSSGNTTVALGSGTVNCTYIDFGSSTPTITGSPGTINSTTGNSNKTFKFNSRDFTQANITINTPSGYTSTLQDGGNLGPLTLSHTSAAGTVKPSTALTSTALTLTKGTLNLNGQTVTTPASTNTSGFTISDTVGGGKLIFTGVTGTVFDGTGLTISNAPAIQIGNSAKTLTGDVTFTPGSSHTFGDLAIKKHAGNYSTIIGAATTFGTITLETPDTSYAYINAAFPSSGSAACTSFVADGDSTHQILFSGNLSDTEGTNTVTYCTITNSAASGGATWKALISAGNVDGGNNSGWTLSSGSGGGGLSLGTKYTGANFMKRR